MISVSCAISGVSPSFPSDYKPFPTDCVSCPPREDFLGFLNNYGDIQTDCVSRPRPVDSDQRVRIQSRRSGLRRPCVPPDRGSKPILAIVTRIAPVPVRTRSSVTLALALSGATHSLPIASVSRWHEPLAADSARAFPRPAEHASLQRREASLHYLDSASFSTNSIVGGSIFVSGGGSILASAQDSRGSGVYFLLGIAMSSRW